MKSTSTLRATGLALALALGLNLPAQAGPFLTDSSRVSQGTASDVTIRGIAGESFSIAYTDAGGVARTKAVTLVTTIGRTTVPAKAGTTITISNTSQPGEPPSTETASRFTPGSEQAVTTLAMNPGSVLNAFGQTLALGGSFTTVGTTADYDSSSPGYGNLGGYIPSSFFDVFAEIGPDHLTIQLDSPSQPFLLNVGSSWDAGLPDSGIAVPYSQILSGMLGLPGGSTQPFTGSISGTVTFFDDNVETIAGDIVLNGIGTGTFSATGRTSIVPTPGALLLSVTGVMLLWGNYRRRPSQGSA